MCGTCEQLVVSYPVLRVELISALVMIMEAISIVLTCIGIDAKASIGITTIIYCGCLHITPPVTINPIINASTAVYSIRLAQSFQLGLLLGWWQL